MTEIGMYRQWMPWMLLAIAFTGCSAGDGVQLGSVTGIITLDGKPVTQASVSFHPVAGGRGSFGKTDADGRYELTYINDKGATVGTHKVTVTTKVWAETGRKPAPGQSAKDLSESAGAGRDEMVDEKYHYKESTPLSAEVKAGENEFDFDLESS